MEHVTEDRKSGPLELRIWKRRLNHTWTNGNCRPWKWLQYNDRKPYRATVKTLETPKLCTNTRMMCRGK